MRGKAAGWMGSANSLARQYRIAPFGSWWCDIPRAQWRRAVHARWRGGEPPESMPRLG